MTNVELIKTVTSDGVRLDGALHASANVTKSLALDAILCLHGVGGNFYSSSLFERLAPPLAETGVPIVTVNTRGHDAAFNGSGGRRFGAAFEIVADCCLDIEAWLQSLSRLGLQRIGLLGHSLGAIKAIYSQAHDPHANVKAVLALSPPRLSHTCFQNSLQSHLYLESLATARNMLKENRGDDLFTASFPFPILITAAGYIDKYGPGEKYNIVKFAGDVRCPLLFAYGQLELEQGSIAFSGVPEAIEALPKEHSPRDVITIDGADHHYAGVQMRLADALRSWLAGQLSI